jgi:pimeloyl-ACP methyl ester carboxylesterase
MLDDASSDDVLVPDMRGYGQSSTPQNVEAYGTKKNTDDLVALLGMLLTSSETPFVLSDWSLTRSTSCACNINQTR